MGFLQTLVPEIDIPECSTERTLAHNLGSEFQQTLNTVARNDNTQACTEIASALSTTPEPKWPTGMLLLLLLPKCCYVVVVVVVVVEWLYYSKRIIIVRWADLSDIFSFDFRWKNVCFCFTSNENCHFSSEKRLPPKTGC